jgi:mannosyltransferase OCH1-like enzyme
MRRPFLGVLAVILVCLIYIRLHRVTLYTIPHYTARRMQPTGDTSIPRILHEYWHSREVPYHMSETIRRVIEENPQFDVYLYSEVEARAFLVKHFPAEVVQAFDSLKPTAYKSDLFRYCVLYKQGGVYMDTKFSFNVPLESLLTSATPLYVRPEPGWCPTKNGIMNGFLAAPPRSKVYQSAIDAIVKSCQAKEYKENDLALTGPCLLGDKVDAEREAAMRDQSRLTFDDPTYTIRLDGKVVGRSYFEYRAEQRATQKEPYYKDLYKARDIYR